MATISPKYAQLNGDIFLRNKTTNELAFSPVFRAVSAELVPSVTTEKLPSTGNKRGTVFTYETDRSLTLNVVANSRHRYMLDNYLLGTSEQRVAAEDVAFALPALAAGQAHPLPAGNILEVVIPGKIVDVDFEVMTSGAIVAITDLEAVPTGATFSHGAYDAHGIFNAEAQTFEFLYVSESSGQSYILYEGLLVPSGSYSLVSESGVGSAPVTFELSESKSAVPDPVLGKFGRVRSF